MIETKLEEWLNRAIGITIFTDVVSFNSRKKESHITIRFHQYDIDEYLQFANYIEENYADYEKVVEINQTGENKIELKFTFNGDDIVEFSVTNVECEKFRINDWFKHQEQGQETNLMAILNQTVTELLSLPELDPDNKACRSIKIHRWDGKLL